MKTLTQQDLFGICCKHFSKWGMRFHFSENKDDKYNFSKTAPWFSRENFGEEYVFMVLDGGGELLFDTKEEMIKIFHQTILDEAGPDDTGVYAAIYGPDGECMSENT